MLITMWDWRVLQLPSCQSVDPTGRNWLLSTLRFLTGSQTIANTKVPKLGTKIDRGERFSLRAVVNELWWVHTEPVLPPVISIWQLPCHPRLNPHERICKQYLKTWYDVLNKLGFVQKTFTLLVPSASAVITRPLLAIGSSSLGKVQFGPAKSASLWAVLVCWSTILPPAIMTKSVGISVKEIF